MLSDNTKYRAAVPFLCYHMHNTHSGGRHRNESLPIQPDMTTAAGHPAEWQVSSDNVYSAIYLITL